MSVASTAGATGGAAAAAATANAIKASGAIVRVEPPDFSLILRKIENPVIVMSKGGFLDKGYKYLTSYKGLIFYTKSKEELMLPGNHELIWAKSIWIPA